MPRPDRQDLFPGALAIMVLQTLRLGPLHGYALAKAIMRASDDLVRVPRDCRDPAGQFAGRDVDSGGAGHARRTGSHAQGRLTGAR